MSSVRVLCITSHASKSAVELDGSAAASPHYHRHHLHGKAHSVHHVSMPQALSKEKGDTKSQSLYYTPVPGVADKSGALESLKFSTSSKT